MHLFEQFNQCGWTVFVCSMHQDLINHAIAHITLQQGKLAENHS